MITEISRSTSLVPTRLGRLAVHDTGPAYPAAAAAAAGPAYPAGDGASSTAGPARTTAPSGSAHRPAPVAVLWHSMFVDSSSWDRVVSRLSAHRRLLVVDGPGYGGSDPLTRVTDMAECALAAGDLLDGLGITEPVDWVGNAWGGHVGYQLIGTQPARIRSLVAVSAPTTPLPDSDRKTLRMLSRVVRLLGPIGPLRAKIADAQLTDASRRNDPHALAVIDGSLGRTTRESLANTLLSFIVGRDDLSEQAARGLVPYLFVASDDRGEWTPEQAVAAAERCVDAEVVVIPGARTLIPVEQPDALAEAVLDFWAAGSDDAARSEE